MNQPQEFSHVHWIGGAPDSGKTTIAKLIAERHHLQLYNYDRTELAHHELLAEGLPAYREFLTASLDERWAYPEPDAMVLCALQSLADRFPLVLADLRKLPSTPGIVAEGFGFTPELLAPLLSTPQQAVWLVPTEEFKLASMQRRNKPSFKDKTSDPERATRNLVARDVWLAELLKMQAESHKLPVFVVDGSRSTEDMATLVEQHFRLTPC